jgi:inhibitor of cysteine peptidase
MDRDTLTLLVIGLAVGSVAAAGAAGPGFVTPDDPGNEGSTIDPDLIPGAPGSPGVDGETGIAQFENRSAFEAYLGRGQLLADDDGFVTRRMVPADAPGPTVTAVADAAPTGGDGAARESGGGSSSDPSRIGDTNVQVAGLDEPDVVKSDDRNFYYAPRDRHVRVGPGEPDAPDTATPDRDVQVVDVSDPPNPERIAGIDDAGRLLRTGDVLVVLGHDELTAYDVSDPAKPERVWTRPLNASVVTARERNGTLYLVTESRVGPETDCPIEPLGPGESIACTDVYHPGAQIAADAAYSAFTIDAASGEVADRASFVGTAANTVVYMSPDALYVTYTVSTPRAELLGTFLREAFDRTPDRLDGRIAEIRSYDVSADSREREIRRAVNGWLESLPDGERETVRESLRSEFRGYVATHRRNLTRTGIVRVGVDDDALSVEATGGVPGRPLNQFSMDQHDGTLRITTTIPRAAGEESGNDLYTLDAGTLERRGSVTGMGDDQEVYAVRYVGDTAYVVTFRRIDPLHVVNLSDPADPEEVGELELPGFSTYLHPIDDDHVLGIGEEESRVKAVLFDVSDPENPTVADDRLLAERFSAVSESHHAFTIDRRHGVFFLPAGDSAVVMDYTNGSLSEEASVTTDGPAERARYVDDYLYVFAQDGITVLDEMTWEVTERLQFDG